MSYLVDALRKAERERYSQQATGWHAAAATHLEAPANSRAGLWLWLIAILLASNVALAIYIWRPRAQYTSTAPSVSAATVKAPVDRPVTPPTRRASVDSSVREPAPAAGGRHAIGAVDQPRRAAAAAPNPTGRPGPAAQSVAPDRGSVGYTKTPFSGRGSGPSVIASRDNADGADGADNLPDQSSIAGVPAVTINGQLYSSVPGRSFILVGGRRYHEGARLASGPAVESIGPNGATLRYQGRRYHVPGPG